MVVFRKSSLSINHTLQRKRGSAVGTPERNLKPAKEVVTKKRERSLGRTLGKLDAENQVAVTDCIEIFVSAGEKPWCE